MNENLKDRLVPEVSVIMKVFNGARFLDYSIGSILNQTFSNFEYIIVDDGSTDDTWRLLEEYSRKDGRIRLYRNEKNEGLPRASNHALKLVSAPFVANQDSDDWSYPSRLEKQLRYLEVHPECVAVGSQMLMIRPDGLPIRLMKFPSSHKNIDFMHINGFILQLPHPAMMGRTEAIRKVGGYREEFPVSIDYDLILRLAEVGEVHNLPDVLVRYRRHEKSITKLRRGKRDESKRRALLQACQRRGLGAPPFQTIPNPSMRSRERGSRMLKLMLYGLKNVLLQPRSPEGWMAIRGSISRLSRKRGGA